MEDFEIAFHYKNVRSPPPPLFSPLPSGPVVRARADDPSSSSALRKHWGHDLTPAAAARGWQSPAFTPLGELVCLAVNVRRGICAFNQPENEVRSINGGNRAAETNRALCFSKKSK